MDDLIIYAHLLYDHDVGQGSPPLPPTPAGEPIPQVTYGSKNTKVARVPPAEGLTPITPQDFTPRLPPRPNNSIHPSARTNPGSPTKSRALPEKALPPMQTEVALEECSHVSPSRESSPLGGTRDDRNSISFTSQSSSPASMKSVQKQLSESSNDVTDTQRL
jgi:hypothetical protein